MNKPMHGFSLIELLVVVAILGVLAVVGLSIYTSNINAAKDQRVVLEGQEIHKAIETDLTAAKMGVSTGGLAANITASDTCALLLDRVVDNLIQQNKKNPFNNSFLVQTASPTTEIPRGSVYLSCAIPSAKISEPDFYLQTCICTESNCPLTPPPAPPQKLDKNICYQL